jgi:glutamate dehydrogenase (NAD(P)+)
MLHSAGMRVVAVTDAGGGVYNSAGLDAASLARHVDQTGSVAGFERSDPLDPKRIWEIECELAVPAALAGVITADVAEKMGAQLIVEAANGPTLPEADPVLERRNIVVIPDILANGDGLLLRVGTRPARFRLGGRPCGRAPEACDVGGLRRSVAPVA